MRNTLQKCLFSVLGLFLVMAVTAQTPIADYPFSGDAKDISATKNNASVHGAFLTKDRFGIAARAFSFDGIQSFLRAPNNPTLNTDYTTVSFWLFANALPPAGEAYILSFGGWQEKWKISLPDHGKMVWTTNNTSGISDMDSGDGNVVVPGVWQHWTFVHNGTTDEIYLNGQKIADKAVSGALNPTLAPLGIGYNPIEKGNYFNGKLDDIQIYGEGLNDTQIQDLYTEQSTAPVIPPGLVASYEFKNNTADASEYNNDASMKDTKFGTDRFGYGNSAAVFNGHSSEVKATNSSVLNSANASISFWVKPNALPASGESFLISNGGWQERLKISLPDHGKVVFTTNSTSGISDMDAGGGHELVPDKWTQVVVVHDGIYDQIYIDGELTNKKAVTGDLNSTDKDLGIGYNTIDGGNWFNGSIDDIHFYNYALTSADITTKFTEQNTFPGNPTDLVASYQFKGNFNDETQFRNNASGNANFTANRFDWANNAVSFNGNDSLIADNSGQLNSDFASISFWINPSEFPASGESFIVSNGGWQQRYKISLPSHGKLVFTTNSTSGISDMDAGGGHELALNQWSHVVMVHDGTNDKIYINGVEVNTKAVSGALNDANTPLGIGFNSIDGGNFFTGSLDDIQIYNVALSDDDVLTLYNEQRVAPVITDEIVANYPMDNSAADISNYHNNGVVENAQLVNDKFGFSNHAYQFNGVDAKITAPNSPQQNVDFTTISFWVNPASLPASGEVFLLSNGGWQERWKISLPSHGKVVFTTNSTSGISDMDAGDGNALVPGSWSHVVMTHDGNFDRIFINGTKVAEKAVTGTLNPTTKDLGIGWNPIDGGNFFDGSMDEVRIYNRALDESEVLALYNEQNQPPVVTDTEAPTAPLNLIATVDHTTVDLSWLPSMDNDGVLVYNIYQNDSKIGTSNTTNLELTGLTPRTTFTFGVSAVDTTGNESTISTIDATTGDEETPDTTPPTAPGNLGGATGSHSVLLSWEASVDDRQVAGYVISVDGDIYDTIPGSQVSILVTGLDPETPYSFEVYAYDAAGNNSIISEITLSTTKEIDTGEPGLVAYYPFDGNANDATPYKNHGTIGGDPVFEVPDHPNGGSNYLKFDGDGDSVIVKNAVQLISDYASVAFWIKVSDINAGDAESYLLDFGHWNERWKISLPTHLKVVWTTNNKTVQFPNLISDMDSGDGNELVKGFWWHVVMVHDGVNDQIFVNGELANSKPVAGVLNSTDNVFGIGSNPIDGGQYFNGGLDEIKLYNKALSASEINSLYKSGTSGNKSIELASSIHALYPNPAKDKVFIKHDIGNNQALTLRVFDIKGRQIDAISYAKGEIPTSILSVNIGKYVPGTYMVNFIYGGKNLGSILFDKI
ncbi:MAG TPA: fibronectin type III domain-containing protein [Saprospiraceae bacterium]|nr:fibronectin type III domain-containing protein [Saprospiraceae bacterium]